jgi:hypothetical protein
MTPEQINQTMEFILQQQASFWAGMEELKASQREQDRSLKAFKEQVAQFTAWAAETAAIQSRRLDEHEKQFKQRDRDYEQRDRQFKQQLEEQRQLAEKHRQEDEQFRRDVMRALNLILNRLFPSNN